MNNKWMKISAILAVGILAFSVAAAGCTGNNGNQNDDGEDGDNGEQETTNIAIVFATGGLGDQSFNDMAYSGLKRAKEEFGDKLDDTYGEPEAISDFPTYQQRYAEQGKYDLIICVGYLQTSALNETAQQYPDQKFMLIDSVVNQPNVRNVVFKENEGEFLAGAMAGLMTQHTSVEGINSQEKIGFVGGMEGPLIGRFEAGYWAGAKYVNEDVEVLSGYVGSWTDSASGNEMAQNFYSNGADIIAHAAGGTGLGVIEASKQTGHYSIGVDDNQDHIGLPSENSTRSHTMTSMMKRVDNAVYRAIKKEVEGEIETGNTVALGLEEGGVSISPMEYAPYVPDSIKTYVKDTIKQKVINGEITVPGSMNNYQTWVEDNAGKGKSYNDIVG